MKRKLILGNSNNPNCDININDPSISGKHLQMTWIADDRLLIRDLDSTNGTKVNGRRIRQKEVMLDDIVEIGRNRLLGKELMRKCRKIWVENQIQFYDEFAILRQIYKDFQKGKKRISSSHRNKVLFLKAGIIVTLFVFVLLFGDDIGIPDNSRYLVIIAGSSLAAFSGDKLFSREDMQLSQQEHNEHYKTLLVCPKCESSLIKRSFSYWEKKRKCPNCNANWVK